jgi:hypothetical protein
MSKNNQDKQLTSVKVDSELFEEFKVFTIRTKFSLQKLVDRSMFLYLKDENFRNHLHNTLNTQLSGSQTIVSSSLL